MTIWSACAKAGRLPAGAFLIGTAVLDGAPQGDQESHRILAVRVMASCLRPAAQRVGASGGSRLRARSLLAAPLVQYLLHS